MSTSLASTGPGASTSTRCLDVLLSTGYDGALSVEHEPYDRDPTDECVQMRQTLETRLETTRGGGDA